TIYQMHAGGPPTTIFAEKGYLTYTPDGRTAVLELENGEIHEIPSDEQGVSRYHRLHFRKHTINIQGAGGMLERTVRNARGDREKSAAQLMAERADVIADYQRSYDSHHQRFVAAGVPESEIATMAPEHAPFLARVGLDIASVFRRSDPLDDLVKRYPKL